MGFYFETCEKEVKAELAAAKAKEGEALAPEEPEVPAGEEELELEPGAPEEELELDLAAQE